MASLIDNSAIHRSEDASVFRGMLYGAPISLFLWAIMLAVALKW